MAELEASVIDHLIEVERHASALLQEAHEEADKRISKARAQADEAFHSQYESIVAAEEKAYDERSGGLAIAYQTAVDDYKADILASAKDTAAFASFCDKVLKA